MNRKLQTKAGAAVYAARKTIVEPVIGQIEQARGFRQFLLRGFKNVQGEWALVCTTHNILGVANRPFSRPEQRVATDRLTQVRLLSADVRLAIDGRPAYDAPRRHRDFCPVWPR